MRTFAIWFLIGVLSIQWFKSLPPIWIGIPLAIGTLLMFRRRSIFGVNFVIAFVCGFIWVLIYAHWISVWVLPQSEEGQPILIRGYIASISKANEHSTAFNFYVPRKGLIKLSVRSNLPVNFHAGDEWQFRVKLKNIHGQMNPGGFDYEAWAYAEGIRAQGYVIPNQENQLIASHWFHYPLTRLRERIFNSLKLNLNHCKNFSWITALAIGERQNVSPEEWELLRKTGTNHLFAIAGLHIGLLVGFIFFLAKFLWTRNHFLLTKYPAQTAASIIALFFGLSYSALAGFSLPTQRASIMLTIFILFDLTRRQSAAWQALALSLMVILILNPLSILSISFWLSFGCVALIIYGVSSRVAPSGLWWKLGRIQFVIAGGLLPLSIWLFGEFTLVGFIANSFCIPIVGFLIVPLTLIGTLLLQLSTTLGWLVFFCVDQLLTLVWKILHLIALIPNANLHFSHSSLMVLFACIIGIILLFSPKGFPLKLYGWLFLIPLCFAAPLHPKMGDAQFTLLDVGQGLASVIQTNKHILIFDTGAKLGSSNDMGESVLVPYLRSIGIKKIDMLVVSHGDNDHIGGAAALQKNFVINEIKTSALDKFKSANLCLQGQKWIWDEVNFEILYPTRELLGEGNDSSCVLRVSTKQHSILLTGDIEKKSEKYLLTNNILLKSDVIVVPHHGSKTSGLPDFIQAVNPTIALFPVGYRNRYHFPNPTVLNTYQNNNSQLFTSVTSGAIFITLNNKSILQPIEYRTTHAKFWNHKI